MANSMPDYTPHDWFRIADTADMASAKLSFAFSEQMSNICFSCQQAAEKYLKGYLFAKTAAEPKYTHDLKLLREQCLKFDSRFEAVAEACEYLTLMVTRARYPYPDEPTSEDMRLAIRYADEVRELAPICELQAEIGYERERSPLGEVADVVKTEAVKSMLRRGVPIDEIAGIVAEFGVGRREVFAVYDSVERSVDAKMKAYSALGLDNQPQNSTGKRRDNDER